MPARSVTYSIAAGALALVCACSTNETSPPGESSPAPPPGAYLSGESCTACLSEACSRPLFFCESDEVCRGQLDCRKQCADPACRYACGDAIGSANPALDAVDGCASIACLSKCRVGSGFDCEGAYSRPVLEGVVEARVRVLEIWGDPVMGVDVWACSSLEPPCDELDRGVTDAEGRVTFHVDASWTYDRAVEIQDPSGEFGKVVAWGGGLIEREPGDVTLVRAADQRRIADLNMRTIDAEVPEKQYLPDRPWLHGTILDCNHKPVRGLTLKVAPEDSAILIQPTVGAYYLEKVERTTPAGTFQALNLPEGTVEISARNPDSEQTVVTAQLMLRAGWHYMGPLQPSAREGSSAADP